MTFPQRSAFRAVSKRTVHHHRLPGGCDHQGVRLPIGVLTGHFGDRGVRPLLHALGIGATSADLLVRRDPLGRRRVQVRFGAWNHVGVHDQRADDCAGRGAALTDAAGLEIHTGLHGHRAAGFAGDWIGRKLSAGRQERSRVSRRALFSCARAKRFLEDSKNRIAFRDQSSGAALRWAFWDLGSDVSVDLLFGIGMAAAILAFIPVEWISS